MSRRLVLVLLVVSTLTAAFAAAAQGAARFYTAGYGSENVGGFELGADGSLAALPGSPFPVGTVGGAGVLGLAFAPEGSRATLGFLITGGTQGYAVAANGSFQVTGALAPSASVTNTAITPDGRFAFAATREFMAVPREGIRRFALNADGSLTPLLPNAALPDDVYGIAISPDGRFLFAQQANQIARFAIGGDGSLTPLGMTPAPSAGLLATSADGRFLFVLGTSEKTTVESFAIGADGGLAKADSVEVGNTSARNFSVAPDDRHLYVPDKNGDAIRGVAIAPDGSLTAMPGGLPVVDAESAAVSPDGRHLVYYGGDSTTNLVEVAAIAADGSLSPLPSQAPWKTGEAQPLLFQPQPAPVAAFTATAAAPGAPASFNAGASQRAARFDWDFGDGTRLDNGGPNPTHVYAAAGVYPVTLSVSDAAGCSAAQIYDGRSTACPGGSATTATAGVDTLPALGKPKAKPKKFRAKPRGKAKGKFGTTFSYSASEPAGVSFTIERKKPGRLFGGKCKPQTQKNKQGHKKCPLFKRLGPLNQKAKAGANKLKWNGRLKGKPLAPGSYRATALATDGAGGRSAPQTVGFRVLPPTK